MDRGLLKLSKTLGSDVQMLDCEFTVVEGPYAKRKFWQLLPHDPFLFVVFGARSGIEVACQCLVECLTL